MFNSESASKPVPVSVKLSDGTTQQGNLIIAMTSDLKRTLNGDGKFLEFENMSGEKCFFAKQSLAQITPIDVPKVKKLNPASTENNFDPFRILKVGPDADPQTIHSAYIEQARLYHPDHFSSVKLPKEMAQYAENMVRLVNAAYNSLNDKGQVSASESIQQEPMVSA